MSKASNSRRRSSQSMDSHDGDLSDVDSLRLDPGRKNGKESVKDVEARKKQNRVAQREFRMRKQLYIKELEAKVELQESSRDEQLDTLKNGLRALIEENQKLREMLSGLAGFIGSGVGGMLPKLGVELPEFEALITRHSKEHVLSVISASKEVHGSGHQNHRPSPEASRSSQAGPSNSSKFPPPTSGAPNPDSMASYTKRRRIDDSSLLRDAEFLVQSQSGLAVAHTFPEYKPPEEPLPPLGSQGFLFNNNMLPPQAQQAQPLPDVSAAVREDERNFKALLEPEFGDVFGLPSDNPKLQAIQLVSYTISQLFSATCSQLSRFTKRQVISPPPLFLPPPDLHPFSLYLDQDVLDPANWELSEGFLRKYWFSIDTEVLEISNRWRRDRGDVPLTIKSLVPDGADFDSIRN